MLVATYGNGDLDKVLLAMRRLPYDELCLISEAAEEELEGLSELRRLESMAGHEVRVERVHVEDFMDLVEEICDVVDKLSGSQNGGSEVILNMSGGTKLVADAALFAAFRLGIRAYHITERTVSLPVMRGVTAKSRFTQLQSRFMMSLDGPRSIPDLVNELRPHGKQSLERVMRELKGMGLVSPRVEDGHVVVSLSAEGHEVRKALAASNGTRGA